MPLTSINSVLAVQPWEAASAAFFVYTLALAVMLRCVRRGGRPRALAFAISGLAVTAGSIMAPPRPVLHDWLIPPVLLLLGYWASGALYAAPMPGAEARLMAIDNWFRIRQIAARTPRVAAEFLEFSYVCVYPLIPIALGLHLRFATHPDAGQFWSVILVTDYICFGTLPWLQTRPPRVLEPRPPWDSRIRLFNRELLHAASIRVNTFPSGHAAEALAAALLMTGGPAPVVAGMFAAAAAVSAGAVLGRYHYLLDALIGWGVAAAVWYLIRCS